MSDRIRAVVTDALSGYSIASIEPTTTRPGNETARVTFDDAGPVYVKTAADTSRRLVRETAALRYAGAHCPVETPGVVAADPHGDPPYLVTDPLPGTVLNDPWTDGADRATLVRQAGRALASVHGARFDRPGVVEGGDESGLELAGETWAKTLAATVEWRASDWFADRFADVPERLAGAIRDLRPTLDRTDPALLHADCSRINVHVDPVGLLDWERALVGDPAFDLVDAAGHLTDQPDVADDERPALVEALHDGYREAGGNLPPGFERRRPLYRAVAHLLVTQTFEEWAPDVDRPDDELAADVRAEFDSRLRRARESLA